MIKEINIRMIGSENPKGHILEVLLAAEWSQSCQLILRYLPKANEKEKLNCHPYRLIVPD